MSADDAAVLLIVATAVPITLFSIGYTFTARGWWREWVGRALFTSAWGLALLVDISLLYNWLGDNYPWRDEVRLTVYSIICVGAWFKLIALVVEKRRAYIERRTK